MGLLIAGVFRSPSLEIFSGNGFSEGVIGIGGQLGPQATGITATFVHTAILSYPLLKFIDVTMGLRVDLQDETLGLEIILYDETAYDL